MSRTSGFTSPVLRPVPTGSCSEKSCRHISPHLGYYNTPSSITQQLGEAEIEVGDAIDDLTDIAIELYDVLWRFDHTSSVDYIFWAIAQLDRGIFFHVLGVDLLLRKSPGNKE